MFFGECPELPFPNPAIANDEADIDEGVESGDGPLDIDALIDSTLNEIKESNKKAAASKPIYIVKNNKIFPYTPKLYPEPAKPTNYYPSYTPAKTYKDPYETTTKEVYQKPPKPLYEQPQSKMFPKYDYSVPANPPDYQSFFKPLNAPYKVSTMAVASSYTNSYYAPNPAPNYHYSEEYKPMPRNYEKIPKKYYDDISYGYDDLYDSLCESFT